MVEPGETVCQFIVVAKLLPGCKLGDCGTHLANEFQNKTKKTQKTLAC